MSSVGGNGSGPSPAQFAAWVDQHSTKDRVEIFHVIDSLVKNRERNGNIPPVDLFGFSAGISLVAPHIRRYLAIIPPQMLLKEVQRFAHLRPEPIVAVFDQRPVGQETQPQDTAVETLLKDKDHSFKSIIVDYDHFLAMKDRYAALNDKRGKTAVRDVIDFPADLAGQRKLVEELFAAMLDFDNVIDGQRQKRGKKRKAGDIAEEEVSFADSTHVRRVKESSNLEIELLSWELVFATRDAQDGRVKMAPWGPEWHYDLFNSFKERFERVKYACKHSKSTVNGLMSGNFVQRLAAAPDNEYRRKVQNLDINRTRDAQVKAGIQALKSGQIRVTEDLGLISPSGGRIAPGHPGSAQLDQERRKITRHKYTSDAARTSRLPIIPAQRQTPPAPAAPSTLTNGPEIAAEDFGRLAPPQTSWEARGQVEFGHAEVYWPGLASNPSGQSFDLEDIDFSRIDWGQYSNIGNGLAELNRAIGSE